MEPRTPSISLIIPAFNEEGYVGACLDAVTANVQRHVLEVIVIDNASTDRTGEIARAYPGVRVVREEHKGLACARQRGYEEAKGDVLAFIDADTRPLPGWIEKISSAFAQDRNLACVSGPYEMYDIPAFSRRISRVWDYFALPFYYIFGYIVIGGNFAIRRNVLDAMNGFDQNIQFYGDDVDIGRRASRYGKVRYWLALVMPSSARRLKKEGYVKTVYRYVANYLSISFFGKAVNHTHTDVR